MKKTTRQTLEVIAVLLLIPLPSLLGADAKLFFGDNVQFRGDLNNSRIRFERTGKGRVAFMGGSITEMNGYRPMVCDCLKKRFPAAEFTFVDAGIASTCSTTGSFRLQHDVLSRGPIDLFFIEFAVNDDQDGHHTRAECIRGMEGIIRHARRNNPAMDIVVTFFVNEAMLKTLQAGEAPLTIESHETVARHYAVSTINLAREVAEEITAGKLTWQQYGGVHPAPFGNAICRTDDRLAFQPRLEARACKHGRCRRPSPSAAARSAELRRGPISRSVRREVQARLVAWRARLEIARGGKRSRFTDIPMLCATEPGDELSLDFEGTAVGAFIVAGPDAGIVEASIDAGPFHRVDLFHEFSKGLHYPRTVLLGSELQPGRHTLRLRISGQTNSGGHAMRIMQFVVN